MCKIGRRDSNKMFWKIATSEKFFSNDYKKKRNILDSFRKIF